MLVARRKPSPPTHTHTHTFPFVLGPSAQASRATVLSGNADDSVIPVQSPVPTRPQSRHENSIPRFVFLSPSCSRSPSFPFLLRDPGLSTPFSNSRLARGMTKVWRLPRTARLVEYFSSGNEGSQFFASPQY